jgi:hypothetical protein
MFKVTKNPTFTHDVTVMVPVDGGFDEQSLKVKYNVLDLDQLQKHELSNGNVKAQGDYCNAIVADFSDMVDDDGKPITCTTALRQKLINTAYVRIPIINAYEAAMTKAKAKN